MKIVPETPQEADLAHRRLMAMEHLLGPVTIMQLPHNPDGGVVSLARLRNAADLVIHRAEADACQAMHQQKC
jgi:hypothetical protein